MRGKGWRNPGGVTCCFGCDKRRLGCRDDCPDWAAHEAKKAAVYAERDRRRNEKPNLRRKAINEKIRVRDFKNRGKIL